MSSSDLTPIFRRKNPEPDNPSPVVKQHKYAFYVNEHEDGSLSSKLTMYRVDNNKIIHDPQIVDLNHPHMALIHEAITYVVTDLMKETEEEVAKPSEAVFVFNPDEHEQDPDGPDGVA